ncbi:MAG: hypothetical protein M1820_007282 [Bogoriella megaspora]|nr:MAG: hypothetical protein M1820_007282 [Bogoriella megaspora]
MGGGEAKDQVLLTLPFPEPKDALSSFRKKHPDIQFTYYDTTQHSQTPVPASLFAKVTILVTLGTLPAKPSDAPKLKWIQAFSAGSDRYPSQPIYRDTDVILTTMSGIHGPQIAEWVVMTTLVTNHKYKQLYELQKQHKWGKTGVQDDYHNVSDLVGQRLGILGYGSIGRQVARMGKAAGMEVIAYTATPKDTPESKKDHGFIVPGTGDPEGEFPKEWYSGLDKKNLRNFLAQDLDVVMVSVPLTKDTEKMLSDEEFKVLGANGKPPLFINIARGKIVNTDALVKALKEDSIRAAALDVTDPEPLPEDSELWDMKNVIVTPHISSVGKAYASRAYTLFEENLQRWEKGEKLLNTVRKGRGY